MGELQLTIIFNLEKFGIHLVFNWFSLSGAGLKSEASFDSKGL